MRASLLRMDGGRFRNRHEAGVGLAEMVARVVAGPCVVAAIPRGGVVLGLPVAERLSAPLTVVYARKLTAPVVPEFAFGAVDEDGELLLDDAAVEALGLGPADIDAVKAQVQAEIRRRMALYGVPPLARYLPGTTTVVLVDDGLATGLTMRAAVAYARRHGAREIIVAAPCASTSAAERFRREADQFVCPVVDPGFMAVGQYYADFAPVTDDQVVSMLARAAAKGAGRATGAGRRLSFTNARGLMLAGELLLPATRPPHPVVVFAHGWGSGKDSPRSRAVAEGLRAAGVASLLFDFTGHGESEGTPAASTPDQQIDDLDAALDALQGLDEVDAGRVGLAGADSGGAVALMTAATDARIRALVLRSANPAGTGDAVDRVSVPTLLVVGELDEPIRAANEALLDHLAEPRRLEIVPKGGHLFEDPDTLRRAVGVTVDWFTEHLGEAPRAGRRRASMAMTDRVQRFLDQQGVRYETLRHKEAFTAQEVAAVSHVPGINLAKVVVLRDSAGSHIMAVLPAPCRVDLHALEAASGRRKLSLATEIEASTLFPDCEPGAFPPFGNLYGLPVYVDSCFHPHESFVFQAGTHEEALRIRFADFERTVRPALGEFCLHAREKLLAG